ncbi:hypothetical protein ABG067_003636 [Albugo candida]
MAGFDRMDLIESTLKQTFYEKVHVRVDASFPTWDVSLTADSGSRALAAHDNLIHVAWEEIAAAKAAKITGDVELEARTTLTESVQQPVQQNIQKAIGPLKAHIAQLQQSLQGRAGRQEAPTGAKSTKPQQQKSAKAAPKENGRAAGDGPDLSKQRTTTKYSESRMQRNPALNKTRSNSTGRTKRTH